MKNGLHKTTPNKETSVKQRSIAAKNRSSVKVVSNASRKSNSRMR